LDAFILGYFCGVQTNNSKATYEQLLLHKLVTQRVQLATESIFFKKHLREWSSLVIDEHIHRIYQEVQHEIDCTQCGNCCKNLEPGLDENEVPMLADATQMELMDFKSKYVAFDGVAYFLKTKPCMFLAECKCTIYNNRPAACAGFPHLDGKDMKYKRSLWENYLVCPIVYLVVERLKQLTNFVHDR
jgi:Fe-S-cluster containining protein